MEISNRENNQNQMEKVLDGLRQDMKKNQMKMEKMEDRLEKMEDNQIEMNKKMEKMEHNF